MGCPLYVRSAGVGRAQVLELGREFASREDGVDWKEDSKSSKVRAMQALTMLVGRGGLALWPGLALCCGWTLELGLSCAWSEKREQDDSTRLLEVCASNTL